MMPSTSKSNLEKAKNSKFVPKPKQRWQVKQPTRNWLELPSDITANILYRIGVKDILENAQKVCTAWCQICKDPSMWRVINTSSLYDPDGPDVIAKAPLREMCKHAVDRSQGQLVDITITDICNDELLRYIADRSSQLRRLEIALCFGDMYGIWTEALKKFSLLEELNLYTAIISKEAIETAGRYCRHLKILKINQAAACIFFDDDNDEESMTVRNEIAVAIGKNLPELRHLELIGNSVSNIGLQVILDGCRHLESLDLRRCRYIDLNGEIGKRCSEQIKYLKLPGDPLEGCQYINRSYSEASDVSSGHGLYSDDDYSEYFDYDDDFTAYYDDDFTACFDDDSTNFEDMNEMLAFMDMFE